MSGKAFQFKRPNVWHYYHLITPASFFPYLCGTETPAAPPEFAALPISGSSKDLPAGRRPSKEVFYEPHGLYSFADVAGFL
jgi:hypothetical protein